MTLANKLTISRIFLAGIFMAFLFGHGLLSKVIALCVFIAASLTDILDGYFAKKRNEVSAFGKLMDPIADKMLTLAAFLAFVEMKIVPAWIVAIIIFREFLITGLRIIALKNGKTIESGRTGKQKTFFQIVVIYAILIFIIFNVQYKFQNIIFFMMLVVTSLTLISGAIYLEKARAYFINEKNR